MSKSELTPQQLERQYKASIQMRKDFTDAVKLFLEDIGPKNYDKIGILLSGGVDSTTLLWTLLDLGVRPHVYTYTTPMTDGMSTDHRKAKELADHYQLPLSIAHMPNDPDYVAQTIERLFRDYMDCWRNVRPDKEVPFLIHEMALEVAKNGTKFLFSGIGEGNIHRLGRKFEIRGRNGKMSDFEVALGQVTWDASQSRGFTRMLSDMGIRFCLPHFISNPRGAFTGLSWDEINRPRKKEATLIAYKEEVDLSGINPQVMPMQSGNSGARQYLDEMIPTSSYATDFVGRRINTAQPFYNALENRYRKTTDGYEAGSGQSNFEVEEKWEWAAHVGNGTEIEERFVESLGSFIDLETGGALNPEKAYESFDDTIAEDDDDLNTNDLFNVFAVEDEEAEDDDDDEVVIYKEEDGSYTTNVDCLGYPLYIGSSQRDCPYARSGACKKFKEDAPRKDFTLCSSYYNSLAERADMLRLFNDAYSINNGAYERGAVWVEEEAERLKSKSEKIIQKNL